MKQGQKLQARKVKFGDVVHLSTARSQNPIADGLERYVGLEHLEPGDLHIRTWGNVADGTTFTSRFAPGQVLFGKRRAYQRKIAVADFAGVCSGDIYVLESKDSSVLLPELLPFICQTDAFFEHAVGTSAGSLSPRTNWSSLSSFEAHLPDIPTQKSILSTLKAVQEEIDALDNLRRSAVQAQRSLLRDLLASTPESSFALVEDLLVGGPKNGISPPANSDGRGFPTLGLGAVRDGRVTADGNLKFVDIPEGQAHPFTLAEDDVLVVRGNGNKSLTGKCGIVSEIPAGCIYPDLLIRLKFNIDEMRPRFAALQWNMPSVHNRLISRAKSTNGIWKINGADLRQHQLKVPSIEVQDSLLLHMSEVEATNSNLVTRLKLAQRIKSHLLNRIA
jgi:type I restriction enzyme, S subunit